MSCVKWRFVFSFMSMLGGVIVYMLRVNMSVALVSMVNSTVFKPRNSSSECVEHINVTKKISSGTFMWSEEEQALILGAFYWGYMIVQIPSGIVLLYLNTKWIYGISTLVTVLLTFFVPIVAETGLYPLIAMRFVMGLFEGPTFPALFAMCGHWVLESESNVVMTLTTSGSVLGTIIGQITAGLVADNLGWQWIFYIMGVVGCIWFFFYALLTANKPQNHWFISEKERGLLVEKIVANHPNHQVTKFRLPWLRLLTSKAFYALLLVNVTMNFTFYSMLNCLPYYIGEVLGFNLSQNGAISSLPYVFGLASVIMSGLFAQYIQHKNIMSKTKLRKVFICTGLLLAAICQICIILTGCNAAGAITLVCATLGMLGLTNSGILVNYLDIAPTMAGSLLSVVNVFNTLAGIVAPYLKAYFTRTGETRANWVNVFTISSVLLLLGCVAFLLLGSASVQPWSMHEDMQAHEVLVEANRYDSDDNEEAPILQKKQRHTVQ